MARSPKREPKSRLRIARELQGWTQEELALRLGVTQEMVSDWERKSTHPSLYYCTKLSEVLGTSIKGLELLSENREESHEQPGLSSEQAQTLIREQQPDRPPPAREPSAHSYWHIPSPRDSFFTGRASLLEEIDRKLNERPGTIAVLALSGLAGIGKTHLAIEYAYRFRGKYQSIFWVSADNLAQEMRRLASLLNLVEQQESDSSLVAYAVKQWFHEHTNWLIIFDNVEDMKALSDVLPQNGNGHIVLTTTLPAVGFITQSIEIPPLNLKEGTTFLLRRAKRIKADKALEDAKEEERENARAIVEEMDGLSLALDQAAAYIEEAPCQIGDYLERYRSRRAVFFEATGVE